MVSGDDSRWMCRSTSTASHDAVLNATTPK
jgi:hypothetical protein